MSFEPNWQHMPGNKISNVPTASFKTWITGFSGIHTLNGYDIGNIHLSGNILMLYSFHFIFGVINLYICIEPVYHWEKSHFI